MPTSDWFIGSVLSLPAQTMSVTQGATTEDCIVAAGDYYLCNPGNTSISLVHAVVDAINTHSLLSDVTFEFMRNRKIRIYSPSETSFSISWTTTALRDKLGATGNFTAASTHTMHGISPLHWSPGKTGLWGPRLGTDGLLVKDTAIGQSGPGRVLATTHNTYRKGEVQYRYVANARVWPKEETSGSFYSFWNEVLSTFSPFKVWREQIEDDSSTTAVTLQSTDALPSGGGYVLERGSGSNVLPFGREFGHVENLHPIEIRYVQAVELSN